MKVLFLIVVVGGKREKKEAKTEALDLDLNPEPSQSTSLNRLVPQVTWESNVKIIR